VGHCNAIVEDLLEFTRAKAIDLVKRDLNKWLGPILDQNIDSKGVKITRNLSPNLPEIPFDSKKMRGIVLNIMDNALQAVIERKKALKGEKPDYHAEIKVSTLRSKMNLNIVVEDNGVGMDEETLKKAFEPLFTKRARGTGLGLANVKKIVEEHGGLVSMESELNHGTKITLSLPIK
jgi:signal transduction histidine kinase